MQFNGRESVKPELRRIIDEILGPLYCPKDYSCSDPDIRQYKTDGQSGFVACLRPNPAECSLALLRTGGHECRCVLRATLLEKLH